MSTSLQRLLPLFERELAGVRPMVLATVAYTAGPTYTKAGAQMLIAEDGEYAGLLSGGCLEGDLRERATRVFETGRCELVRYDMRGPDDLLFGLGSGCEGAMDILLQRLDEQGCWQPLQRQVQAWRDRRAERLLLIVRAGAAQEICALGAGVFLPDGTAFGTTDAARIDALRQAGVRLDGDLSSTLVAAPWPGAQLLLLVQAAPPRLLLLGAGPDAQPVAQLALFLGWSLTVIDHRSHYARLERFPGAEAVHDGGAPTLERLLRSGSSGRFDAAIVMSHHLNSDLGYLRVLATSSIGYVGLLGPASRRDRLLQDLGEPHASALAARLRAPIGLDLGAASPEGIALSIVAEIQATLAGNVSMEPLSALRPCRIGSEVTA